ncbi:MAG: vWA domain-containing protein [Nitrosotalea sp.]
MISSEENFYDCAYRLFYEFSNTKPEQAGLTFSKKTIYPLLQTKPYLKMTIPLPKRIGEDYVFEGLLFENSDEGRKNLWALFLATLYHLAAHAAISDYQNYEDWRKNKNEDSCWLVIDFMEDIRIQQYIEHSDPDISKNIHDMESKLENNSKKENYDSQNVRKHKSYRQDEDARILEYIKTRILESRDENKKELVDIANLTYGNRNLLQPVSLPNREYHVPTWLLKFETQAPVLSFSGIMAEQAVKLDELYQNDMLAKARIVKRYKKHMMKLHFDDILVPSGNLQTFEQIKLKTLPMVRRIRQQLRMITNLVDEPRVDQIGYVDMQMAIQAIASEGQSTDIFERDEPRRREEAWMILIDKSASMGLRFDHLKEFVTCISESANELAGKHDAWALCSFDNNFQILKDFNEKYNKEVQSRIGSFENGGLSLLPDALELSTRVLNEDPREKKYLFVITDGHPCGYERINEAFSKIVKKTELSEINLIAIGVSKGVTRNFRNSARGKDLKTLVTKFITAYRIASDM